MKKDIIKQFSLPSYIKDKSFADASKAIDKKFQDRNDKASLATKEELLSRLSKAQEYIKMQNSLATNSTEVPDMMDGQIPDGIEEFAEGGFMNDFNAGLDILDEGLNISNQLFGDTNIDTSGNQSYEKVDVTGSTINGLASGASAGATFGPLGAGIGAAIGGLSGIIGAGRKNKDIQKANGNKSLSNTSHYRSDFAFGGSLDDIFSVTPKAQADLNLAANASSGIFDTNLSNTIPAQTTKAMSEPSKGKRFVNDLGNIFDSTKSNLGQIASYAPIAGNLLELNKLSKDTTERGSRLTNTYTPDLFDETSLINKINQNDVNSALTESSGGDLGSLRSNLLGANLNKKKAISDAMIKGESINRDEGRFKFSNELNRDRVNVRLDENYLQRKDQDEAAYESTKSNLKRQIFEDIGDVGREEVNKKLVKDLFGYKWNGKYYTDTKGNKYTQKQVAQKYKKLKDDEAVANAYGGYLNR